MNGVILTQNKTSIDLFQMSNCTGSDDGLSDLCCEAPAMTECLCQGMLYDGSCWFRYHLGVL